MEAITQDFLKEKQSIKVPNPWEAGNYLRSPNAGSGNINRLTNTVFSFQVHNLLPTSDDDILDGHFTFLVNYKTFEYFVYSHAYYGSLTYTTETRNDNLYNSSNLPEISKQRVEGYIAHKLLGAYFYDRNAINSNGANLFSNGKKEADGNRTRFMDGAKWSLICDYRNYIWSDLTVNSIDEKDLPLVKELDKDFRVNEVGQINLSKLLVRKRDNRSWGYEVLVQVLINNEPKELIIRRVKEYSFMYTTIFDKDMNRITEYFSGANQFRQLNQVVKGLFQYSY